MQASAGLVTRAVAMSIQCLREHAALSLLFAAEVWADADITLSFSVRRGCTLPICVRDMGAQKGVMGASQSARRQTSCRQLCVSHPATMQHVQAFLFRLGVSMQLSFEPVAYGCAYYHVTPHH